MRKSKKKKKIIVKIEQGEEKMKVLVVLRMLRFGEIRVCFVFF